MEEGIAMSRMPQRTSRRSGPHREGLHFTHRMRALCQDAVRRVPELGHVDLGRVAIGFCQTRKPVRHGLYASLTPLRFAGGRVETSRRGRLWRVQRVVDAAGQEMLYILRFYLPRFLQLDFHEKIVTVFHELWHIGPRFDGDVRRFHGRCYAHSGSQKHYDAHVGRLAEKWLAAPPPESILGFLRPDFAGLLERYGRVYGEKIPVPTLVPVP